MAFLALSPADVKEKLNMKTAKESVCAILAALNETYPDNSIRIKTFRIAFQNFRSSDITMVLYYDDGRLVVAHEEYLDRTAHSLAAKANYEDQAEAITRKAKYSPTPDDIVYIVIEKQRFRTMFARDEGELAGRLVRKFERGPKRLPNREGLSKATLMKCSGYANEYFTYNPTATDLPLPVTYPRKHISSSSKYDTHYDPHMALILPETIEDIIIPWLRSMEKLPNKIKDKSNIPPLKLPNDLLGKIHLYGAVLQLGLPKFVQEPLIKKLCQDLYSRRLSACELEALEICVARFHAHTVPVLDPVINHFIGTYAFRTQEDRVDSEPAQRLEGGQSESSELTSSQSEPDLEKPDNSRFLDYSNENAGRRDYRLDTVIVPPQLPIIGHCIRHWAGVRKKRSTAAARIEYPLNIGICKKYWRRSLTHAIRPSHLQREGDDFEEKSMNLLKDWDEYQTRGPGWVIAQTPTAQPPADPIDSDLP